MTEQGWRQAPLPLRKTAPKCLHLGLVGASLALHRHAVGHEWVCTCGDVFVVVYSSEDGRSKKLVPDWRGKS